MIPSVLKNFNAFVDGYGYAGIVDEVAPPKLALKTEEHRAGGMDAPVELDMGTEKLEMELTLAQPVADVIKRWGNNDPDTPLTLRGALDGPDGVVGIVINARGLMREVDMGSWKAGEKAQTKLTVALRYYKYTQADKELIEIDVENMVRKIDGTDVLTEIRSAIGL